MDSQTQTEIAVPDQDVIDTTLLVEKLISLSPKHQNGNTIPSEAVYPIKSVICSSPELSSDNTLNGNERLTCSDDDNLETLGRKVSEILNANRLVSPMDNSNGNDPILPHK